MPLRRFSSLNIQNLLFGYFNASSQQPNDTSAAAAAVAAVFIVFFVYNIQESIEHVYLYG